MKKISALLLLLTLLLTGCSLKGVETDYLAAIMVEDEIYYLSSEIPAEVDESAVIGYTESYTDTFPEKNNQTNFNRETDMPIARVEGGVAVLYNDEWRLCRPKDAGPQEDGEVSPAPSQAPEIYRNAEDGALTSPPKMTVTYGDTSVEISAGSCSWYWDNKDGTSSGMEADAMHPLQARDYMTPLVLPEGEGPYTIYLEFDVAPTDVSILCWDDWDEDIEAGKTTKLTRSEERGNGVYEIVVENSGCIYEITAKYSGKNYHGTARYSFCTAADAYTFGAAVSWANWSDDPKIKELALNSDMIALGAGRHIPIYKCDTMDELNEFKASFADVFTMDGAWDEVPSFNDVTDDYSEAFFAKNTLLLVYVEAGSCTPRFGVESVYEENGAFTVAVECTYEPEEGDTAMAGWLFAVAVRKELIKDCSGFDAVLR